ncbi:MAG: hypothetical protein ACREV4_15790 [Gammaproteobacteria bacterium]
MQRRYTYLQALLFFGLVFHALSAHADHLSGGLGIEQTAPINTESAVPLKQGSWIAGVRTEYVNNDSFSDQELITLRGIGINRDGEADEDLHSIDSILGVSLRAAYGVTENLTVGFRLPYVRRENIREPEEGHAHGANPIVVHDIVEHGDSAGIGDTTFFGQYRFYHDGSSDIAALFGVKTPTGETGEEGFEGEHFGGRFVTDVFPSEEEEGHHHQGTRLETHQQPGSGSWDGIVGVAYSRSISPVNFDTSVLYTVVSEGSQDTDLGDIFNYNFALSHPTNAFVPCQPCSWNLVLELNGEWRDKEERGDIEIGNSGGHVLYLAPGFRFIGPGGWNMALSAGYPVVNDLNGDQSEPDYRIVGTVNFNF